MIILLILVAGIIVLILWSGLFIMLGFTLGLLSKRKKQKPAPQHPECENISQNTSQDQEELSFAQAMDNPIFSQFVSDRPFMKSWLVNNLITSVWFDDATIEVGVANLQRHQDLLKEALKDADEISFIFGFKAHE
jgi:hypothetical protein